jgi:hypothetical protein
MNIEVNGLCKIYPNGHAAINVMRTVTKEQEKTSS